MSKDKKNEALCLPGAVLPEIERTRMREKKRTQGVPEFFRG